MGELYIILLLLLNVIGILYMGYVFQQILMDVLVCYYCMCGYDMLWQVGIDYVGIVIEMVVSCNLVLEGKGEICDLLGCEGFIGKVWEWKQQFGDIIECQMCCFGIFVDWLCSIFIMDLQLLVVVNEVFVCWYEQGLIYRGQCLVNWDLVLKIVIFDLEVESVEEDGFLWLIVYMLDEGLSYEYVECDVDGVEILCEICDYLVVVIICLEMLLGDIVVMVYLEDECYVYLIGKSVVLLLIGCCVLVIVDDYVDCVFGIGVVKVILVYDFNDYEVGVCYSLLMINLFILVVVLNENVLECFWGLDCYDVCKVVLVELEDLGILVEIKVYKL